MDPDHPDPDPTLDLTPFFSEFKDGKFFFSSYFLLAGKFNFLVKFFGKILFCKHYFSLSFIVGVHIGARALHVLNLISFGNIARLSQWGGISSF